MDPLVVCGPAANVGTRGVQAETGALQGGKHGVSQSRMVGFWVIIMYFIHPALKKRQKICVNFNQRCTQVNFNIENCVMVFVISLKNEVQLQQVSLTDVDAV